MEPKFFKSGAEFGKWLDKHGATETAVLLGFYSARSSKTGLTYKQAVDEALCAGWIDGTGGRIDEERYTVRFTPRRPKSNWSAVNIARVEEFKALGLMKPSGLAAYERRVLKKSSPYSHENPPKALDSASLFKANAKAWAFFNAQRPSYQRSAAFWVLSAVKEETRARRLQTLIADSAQQRWVKPFITGQPKNTNER
jgi:uncharacterized protein YdeI (YjbR/CyaY-like superfamily)